MNSVRALRIAIDLDAIRHNLNVARQLSSGQKCFAVLKADAYGHGAIRVAKALADADAFAVVTVNEAIELRNATIDKPILVLQGAHTQPECEAFIRHRLWPVIHCEEQLRWFSNLSDSSNLHPWLKVDTGMGRLGFLPHRAQALLRETHGLNWYGALTHFALADEVDNATTAEQIQGFSSLDAPVSVQRSLANSAGVLAWPDSVADWARPGIMLYGSNPIAGASATDVALRPAMQVSAPLISCKLYAAGATIGYGGAFVCPKPMKVGYLAIGYGDGFPRVLDRTATVWLAGQRCPIIGRISMDSIAVDLTGIDKAQLGAEAVLWGGEHPVELLAEAAGTISYELLTSIKGQREYNEPE